MTCATPFLKRVHRDGIEKRGNWRHWDAMIGPLVYNSAVILEVQLERGRELTCDSSIPFSVGFA
jgi:hypothetical protein